MKEIDVCSKPCPQPVIETKKAMEISPEEVLEVTVDDEAAKVNVSRFAKSRNYKVKIKEAPGGKSLLTLSPPGKSVEKDIKEKNKKSSGSVFFLKTYSLGAPDKELGNLLMKTLFQTIPDLENIPS